MKRVYRKTADAMSAHICLMDPCKRPEVVYVRLRAKYGVHRLYYERLQHPTHTDLVEAEGYPNFVSFFIYE